MNEKYKLGDFGRWKFYKRIKVKGEYYDVGFDIEGAMVTETDLKNIWLRGTDGQEYPVPKKNIREFEPIEAPMVIEELLIELKK